MTMNYKKIDRYILKKYLTSFLLAISLIIIIVITFDLSEKMDDFLHNNAPLKDIILIYYANFIPTFVNMYSPLFIFISTIFFTSKMAGNTEIIAILGSGISYRRMLRPYIHGALAVATLVMLLGNFVIPLSNKSEAEFDRKYVHTITANRNYFSNIHFQSDSTRQVYAESYDKSQLTVFRMQCDEFDADKNLVARTTADRMVFDTISHLWEISQYTHRTISPTKETLIKQNQAKVDLQLVPDDFNEAGKKLATMVTPELLTYIHQQQLRGSASVTAAKIELYQRLLNPLAVIVMTFIGVAISSRKTRGGIGVHLAIGISIAFSFIVFMKITTVFAINGNLAPFLSVLMPQIVYGIASAYLIKTAPK